MTAANENVTVICGSGDLLTIVNELRDKIIMGEVEGLAFIACLTPNHEAEGIGIAWRDDMLYPYARLIAGLDAVKMLLHSRADEVICSPAGAG